MSENELLPMTSNHQDHEDDDSPLFTAITPETASSGNSSSLTPPIDARPRCGSGFAQSPSFLQVHNNEQLLSVSGDDQSGGLAPKKSYRGTYRKKSTSSARSGSYVWSSFQSLQGAVNSPSPSTNKLEVPAGGDVDAILPPESPIVTPKKTTACYRQVSDCKDSRRGNIFSSSLKRVLPNWFLTGGNQKQQLDKTVSDQERRCQQLTYGGDSDSDAMLFDSENSPMAKQMSLPDRCDALQPNTSNGATRGSASCDNSKGSQLLCSVSELGDDNAHQQTEQESNLGGSIENFLMAGNKLNSMERYSAYSPNSVQQQQKKEFDLEKFAFGTAVKKRASDLNANDFLLPPVPKESAGPRRAFSLRFGLGRNKSTMEQSKSSSRFPRRLGSVSKSPAGSPLPEIVLTESALESLEDGSLPKLNRHTPSRSSSVRYHIEAFFEVGDNRLAMKLFGNRRALDKEKERHMCTARYVIHPCSKFRFYWDLIMLMLLLSNMVLLPMAIAFFSEDFMEPGWLTFNCISDTFFILDIIINFRSGVIADEPGSEVILDPHQIAVYYMKTWFFIDFISSIPIDYIFMIIVFFDGQPMHTNTSLLHAGRAFRIMRLAKLLGLLRLLRLSRLVRYINQWQEIMIYVEGVAVHHMIGDGKFLNVATMVLRITNLIGLTFLLAHWNGCLQYIVPMLQGYPENSWVTKRGIQNATWFRQYTLSIFRALSHMLSIGYGQDIPDTTAEVWLTIGSMLAGATCYAMFVGHMTSLIQSYDSSRRMYTEKVKQVQEYMFYRKLPRNLRDRITDYYEHRYQGKMFDETSIMDELSQSLREDVIRYNCRVLIQRVPFFENAEQSFLSDVLTKLKPELYQPSDLIIKEGTIGKRMYFIQDGSVDIIKNNEIATTLTEGSYFGEICLLTNTKRCATVRAVTYCQLFSLHKEDFTEVLQHYPVMKRTLKGIAAQRLYKIGENPRLVSRSDELAEDLNTAHEILNEPQGMTTVTKPGSCIPEEYTDNVPAGQRNNRRNARPLRGAAPSMFRENSTGSSLGPHAAPAVNSHIYRQSAMPMTLLSGTSTPIGEESSTSMPLLLENAPATKV